QRADPLPVTGRADPVIMVAGAENAGKQGKADNDIEPFFDDFAVDAVELDHQEGEDRRHEEFPHAFNPQMDDVPPVELVEREIDRIVEGEEEEQRQPPQTEQKNVGYGGLAALERRQRDVEQEHQADNDDADLDD